MKLRLGSTGHEAHAAWALGGDDELGVVHVGDIVDLDQIELAHEAAVQHLRGEKEQRNRGTERQRDRETERQRDRGTETCVVIIMGYVEKRVCQY